LLEPGVGLVDTIPGDIYILGKSFGRAFSYAFKGIAAGQGNYRAQY